MSHINWRKDEGLSVAGDRYARSKAAYEEACHWIPGGCNTSGRSIDPPIIFSGARGTRLYDIDGNDYIDLQMGFGAVILGHAHPSVNQRISDELSRIDLIGAGTTEVEVEFAQGIVSLIPSAERAIFCSSGSEAVLHAIRLSRGVTERKKILKFHGCYHGWNCFVFTGVAKVAGPAGLTRNKSAGTLPEATAHTLLATFNDLESVESQLVRHRGEVACVLVEPIAHNMGSISPEPGFLEGLRELCDRHGSLLIFDEVITGFRHALGGYQSICGIRPDITVLGKAIANGFPCAAVCGPAKIMDCFSTAGGEIFYAGTFNGHPGAMAAGLATTQELSRPGFYDKLFALGEQLRSGLREIVERRSLPCVVTGYGSVHVVYFLTGTVRDHSDVGRNDDKRDVAFRRKMMDRGVFMLSHPRMRHYICGEHTTHDIDRVLEAADDALGEVFA